MGILFSNPRPGAMQCRTIHLMLTQILWNSMISIISGGGCSTESYKRTSEIPGLVIGEESLKWIQY